MRSSHFRRRGRRRERCGWSLSGARVMMRPIAIATPNAQVLLAGNTHAYLHTTIRSIVCGVGWNVPNQIAATDICRNPVEAFDNLIVSVWKVRDSARDIGQLAEYSRVAREPVPAVCRGNCVHDGVAIARVGDHLLFRVRARVVLAIREHDENPFL